MRKAKGSYTIEAAIILPAVLLVIASLYVFFTAMVLEIRLEGAVESVGRSASAYYLAVEKIAETVNEGKEAAEDSSGNVTRNSSKSASGLNGALKSKSSGLVDALDVVSDGDEESSLENLLKDAVGSVLWYPISETIVKAWVLSEVGDDWAENSLI